jgi:PAS domain S-box-containing protein
MDESARVKSLIESLELQQAELNAQNDALQAILKALAHSNAELERVARRYRDLYDLAPMPYVTLDANRSIVLVNAAAAKLLSRPPAQLVGARFDVLVAADHRSAFREFLAQATHDTAELESSLQLADDSPAKEVLLRGEPYAEEGQSRWLLSIVDVTAHKEAERERTRLERQMLAIQKLESLEVLAGGVAHDFNNLLTVILSSIERARRVIGNEHLLRRTLDDMSDAALHGASLARQMLLYSGKRLFTKEPVDLFGLVRELEPLAIAAAMPVTLEFEIAEDSVFIEGDSTQLRQLILNLVTNAAEAIGKHDSAIKVSLTNDDKNVLLTISDTGPGMSDETSRRMFEPFFSTKLGGRGLGLAVVHGIIRAHGGTLRVVTDLGDGTTFEISLPKTSLAATRPAQATVAAPAVRPLLTGTLLLVDDMPEVVDGLADLLELLGFKAIVAYDGDEAVECLRANPDGIDAAIVDLSMPKMDGIASAAAFREIRPDLPIALTSGCDELPNGGDRLFQALLSKPYTSADLMLVLAQLLAERQPRPATTRAAKDR